MELSTITNRNKYTYTTINCNKFIHSTIAKYSKILYTFSMSVRKIKKSYISCTGYFPSYKNKQPIAYESVLERDFYLLLEYTPEVISYIEQPFHIFYKLFEKSTRYTPDALVTYTNGTQKVFEIKYQKEIDKDEILRDKLKVLSNVIPAQKSIPFEIFTDQSINAVYLSNAKFLYKYGAIPDDIKKTQQIRKIITESVEGITIQAILWKISASKSLHLHYIPYIWKEVFLHYPMMGLSQKLTMNSSLKKEFYA